MPTEYIDYPTSPVETPPAALSEVRRRRVLAFLVDYAIVAALCFLVGIVVFFLGFLTFGAAWLFYGIMIPAVALAYIALTMGGDEQATIGMRVFSLKIIRLDGRRVDGLLAIVHALIFWVTLVSLLVLVVSFFSSRKRLIQDILLGTTVVRSDIG